MPTLERLRRMVRTLFRRPELERDMQDEMRFHVEMEAAELVRAGVPAADAMRQALLRFGGVDRYKEVARDLSGVRWISDAGADVRYALRSLARTPAFSLVAILALALGIGANAAAFGVADAIAFRPLDVHEPDRLAAVFGQRDGESGYLNLSYPVYEAVRREAAGVRDVAAFTEGPVTLEGIDGARVAWAHHVTGNLLQLLGVLPQHGRMLATEDEREPVVVLGHAIWRSQFGADPDVVGHQLRLNGTPFTVIGVAPESFVGTRLFSYAPALWVPLGMHEVTIPGSASLLEQAGGGRFQAVARLADGNALTAATASMNAVAARLIERHPGDLEGLRLRLISNRTAINPWLAPPERMRMVGFVMLSGVALVLLVACGNVANLLLARMAARRREIAIRLSLGASRGRLLRQLLTESLVLAGLGCVAALPLGLLVLEAMASLAPTLDYATAFHPSLDARVLAYAAAIALISGIIFGLAPAIRSASPRIAPALREAGRGNGPRRSRLRDALVVGQLALSLVVLIAAGLFARSLGNARAMHPGFVVDGAVVFTLDPQLGGNHDAEQTARLYRDLLEALRAVPGVQSVARGSSVPLDGSSSSMEVYAASGSSGQDAPVRVDYHIVDDDWFRVLGMEVVTGRGFAAADSMRAVPGAVISEELARRLWPGDDPLGRQLRLGRRDGDVVEVIGTTRTAKYRSLGESPRPAMALAISRSPRSRTVVVLRHEGDPAAIQAAVLRELRTIDPTLPVIGLKTLREHIAPSFAAIEGGAWAAGMFGALALALAASGLFGVVSYTVVQRTQEFAIRVALGARTRQVVRLVLARGLLLVVLGVGLGTLLVLPLGTVLSGMLFEVRPWDPVTIVSVVVLLGAIALLASVLPAYRAARVDPVIAMRSE